MAGCKQFNTLLEPAENKLFLKAQSSRMRARGHNRANSDCIAEEKKIMVRLVKTGTGAQGQNLHPWRSPAPSRPGREEHNPTGSALCGTATRLLPQQPGL